MASRTARYSWSSVPAESSAASRNTGSPAGSAGEAEAPVQHHAAVTAAGELGEDLGGPAAQFRGEPVLQGGVGPLQRLHGQADGAVLRLQPGPLFLQRRPAAPAGPQDFSGLGAGR